MGRGVARSIFQRIQIMNAHALNNAVKMRLCMRKLVLGQNQRAAENNKNRLLSFNLKIKK